MIVQGCKMEGRVPVILSLVYEPGSRHFRQQNSHCTEKKNHKNNSIFFSKIQMIKKGDDHDEDDEVFVDAFLAIATKVLKRASRKTQSKTT